MSRHAATRASALALLALLATLPTTAGAADSDASFQSTVLRANRVGLTVTNFGALGNNFRDRSPSLEFPLGSNYEHLTHAGLWVGAHATGAGGPFTSVVTGMHDASVGANITLLSEWTPMSDVLQRSALPSSVDYDPAAASDLDLISVYDDHVAKSTLSDPEPHVPIGVTVRQQVYVWSGAGKQDVIILRFVVGNGGAHDLTDVWVGLYTEFASGNKSAYSCWPPSSSCGGSLGSWFAKKWLTYDDSLRMVREHYCANQPVPTNCNLGLVPPWVGLKLLTRPAAGQNVTLATWAYSPGNTTRDEDTERYALMSAGTIANLNTPDMLPISGDPAELLALGPFASIAPGDSVTVDFALAGGDTLDSLWTTANAAQRFHDTGEFDSVVPVAASLVSAEAAPGLVRLRWWSDAGLPAVVERSPDGARWSALGTVSPDGTGALRFDDRAVAPGARYAYRLRFVDGSATSVTWVTVPLRAVFALHGARPNPVEGGDPVVAFALDDPARVTVELFDLAGRRVRALTLDAPAPGEHLVRLTGGARLAPGVYTLGLAQGDRRAVGRVSVMR